MRFAIIQSLSVFAMLIAPAMSRADIVIHTVGDFLNAIVYSPGGDLPFDEEYNYGSISLPFDDSVSVFAQGNDTASASGNVTGSIADDGSELVFDLTTELFVSGPEAGGRVDVLASVEFFITDRPALITMDWTPGSHVVIDLLPEGESLIEIGQFPTFSSFTHVLNPGFHTLSAWLFSAKNSGTVPDANPGALHIAIVPETSALWMVAVGAGAASLFPRFRRSRKAAA